MSSAHISSSASDEQNERASQRSGSFEEPEPIPLGIRLDDKYHVRRILGRGSMGIVYLAKDLRLERDVAIKVLAPKYAQNERVAVRFRREAVSMAKVSNENVVQIYASGDYQSYPYFVMTYVQGYTVANLIEKANEREEQLYLDVVIGILRQVCRGLHAVHESGIVHRDIKPANMLIGPKFQVAIADFGLVETAESSAAGRDLAGTPLYLAPELIRRQKVPDDQRHLSDIYALGVSTYEMLAGRVPFDGESIREILRRHLDHPAPLISEIRSDVPLAIDEVLGRAMHKEPLERYPSCIAFMEALIAARSNNAVSTAAPAPSSTRILIVDDDAQTRTIYQTALKVGYPEATIFTAADGVTGLELAKSSRPDVIILDLDLPKMNGLELCAALRGDELTAAVPILIVTAGDITQSRGVLKSLGVRELLRKPVDLTNLINITRKALGRSESQSAIPT